MLVFQDVNVLRQRTLRICDCFSADGRRFDLPKDGQGSQADFRDKILKLEKEITTIAKVIQMSRGQLRQYLAEGSKMEHTDVSSLAICKLFVEKERSTYEALNMLHQSGNVFSGYIWSPADKKTLVKELNNSSSANSSLQIEEVEFDKLNPPTCFKTNDFTEVF